MSDSHWDTLETRVLKEQLTAANERAERWKGVAERMEVILREHHAYYQYPRIVKYLAKLREGES